MTEDLYGTGPSLFEPSVDHAALPFCVQTCRLSLDSTRTTVAGLHRLNEELEVRQPADPFLNALRVPPSGKSCCVSSSSPLRPHTITPRRRV